MAQPWFKIPLAKQVYRGRLAGVGGREVAIKVPLSDFTVKYIRSHFIDFLL